MTTDKVTPGNVSTGINRWLYGAFVVFCIYFLIRGNLVDAASNLGIALIFDPFNPSVKWQDRKLYQRVWLLVHIAFVIGLFVTGFLMKK